MSLLPTLCVAPLAKVMQRFWRSVCAGDLCLKLSCSRARHSSAHLLNVGRSTAIAKCSAHPMHVSSSLTAIQRMATFSMIHPRPLRWTPLVDRTGVELSESPAAHANDANTRSGGSSITFELSPVAFLASWNTSAGVRQPKA